MGKYSEILNIGSEPVNQDNPVGESVSYDAGYEQVENEIGKLQSLSGGDVNWNLIIKTGADILSGKSKDLSVAGWLCLGLFKESGFEGLAVGLTIYYDVISVYWESLYPAVKRLRRRANTIEWLFENINKTLSGSALRLDDNFKLCNDKIITIIDFADKKLGDSFPFAVFNEVKRTLSAKLSEYEAKTSPVSPPDAKRGKVPAPSAPPLIADGEINDADTAHKALKKALAVIKKSACLLRDEEDTNPLYYRLARISIWSMIAKLPANNDFVTPIPEIQHDLLVKFKEMENNGNWQVLLKIAETQFVNTPFWLDLQRYSSQSLENMGGKYSLVKDVVCEETLYLIHRFPDIVELKFAGGTPFADDETKAWIENLARSKMSADSDSDNKVDNTRAQQEETIKTVRRLVAKNKLKEAADTWHADYILDSSGRSSFTSRLELAGIFVKAKKYHQAIFQLELLDDDVQYYNLEEWDPTLAVEVVRSLIQAIQAGAEAKTTEYIDKLNCLKKRLYKLDLAAALTVV